MKHFKVLSLLIVSLVISAQTKAADLNPLHDKDKFAVAFNKLSSSESGETRVRVRVALCVGYNKCEELVKSPVISIKKGETIDFKQRPTRQRVSKEFSGRDINDGLEKLAHQFRKEVREPVPQLAVQLVTVDKNEKVLKKSKAAYVNFPGLDEKGDENHVVSHDVNITLEGLDLTVAIGIQRN